MYFFLCKLGILAFTGDFFITKELKTVFLLEVLRHQNRPHLHYSKYFHRYQVTAKALCRTFRFPNISSKAQSKNTYLLNTDIQYAVVCNSHRTGCKSIILVTSIAGIFT